MKQSKLSKKVSRKRSQSKPKKIYKRLKRVLDNRYRLFIDPGTKSTGWALFCGCTYLRSGTITATRGEDDVFWRLFQIAEQYHALMVSEETIDEVYLEQLPRRCHHYTHWSVGVIGAVFSERSDIISAEDMPVQAWQKYAEWNGERYPLHSYEANVKSEDELAAIGMGLYFLNGRKDESDGKEI